MMENIKNILFDSISKEEMDEAIIGNLRNDILASSEEAVSKEKTMDNFESVFSMTVDEPVKDMVKEPLHCELDTEVKPWIVLNNKPKVKRRVPRKWFAPFYYMYCKVKTCF